MLKNITLSALAMSVIMLVGSCAKEGPTGPTGLTGATGVTFTGAVNGHVMLYDEYGSRVLTGLDSSLISLNGGIAINPDMNGYYIFDSLQTNDYVITASNTGYGATRLNKFQFLTDSLNKDIKMSAIPDFSPQAMHVFAGAAGDSVVITFAPEGRPRNCILFINSTASVGNLPANYLSYYTKAIPAGQAKIAILIPAQDIHNDGIASGSLVYYAAYGYVVSDASVYEDFATGKNIFNAVSANPVTDSATAP